MRDRSLTRRQVLGGLAKSAGGLLLAASLPLRPVEAAAKRFWQLDRTMIGQPVEPQYDPIYADQFEVDADGWLASAETRARVPEWLERQWRTPQTGLQTAEETVAEVKQRYAQLHPDDAFIHSGKQTFTLRKFNYEIEMAYDTWHQIRRMQIDRVALEIVRRSKEAYPWTA